MVFVVPRLLNAIRMLEYSFQFVFDVRGIADLSPHSDRTIELGHPSNNCPSRASLQETGRTAFYRAYPASHEGMNLRPQPPS